MNDKRTQDVYNSGGGDVDLENYLLAEPQRTIFFSRPLDIQHSGKSSTAASARLRPWLGGDVSLDGRCWSDRSNAANERGDDRTMADKGSSDGIYWSKQLNQAAKNRCDQM